MEIDSESFSCDIVIEEKFIPDDNEQDLIDNDVPNVNFKNHQINHQIVDHQNNQDQNPTENNAKSQLFNGQLYKCICNKRYKTNGVFKQHQNICTFQKNNLFVCRVFKCYATFDNQADFEIHKLNGLCIPTETKKYTKILDTIRNFACDHEDCTAKFPTKKRLNQHKRSVHSTRKFACLYCDLTFTRKFCKIRHEKRKHFKRPKNVAKKSKKLDKSQEFQVKCEPKIKEISNNGDSRIETEAEKMKNSRGRITRSQNKKTNFSKFFELEKKTAENQAESDGDTSTTASFVDQDDIEDILVKALSDSDENDQILKVSKWVHNEKLKSIELQDPYDSDENEQVLNVSKQRKNVKKQFELEESDEYLCSMCHESFTRKIDANNHEKNCQNVKKSKNIEMDQVEFSCEYEDCGAILADIAKYNLHIDVVHLKIPQNKWRKKRESDDRGCFLCRKYFRFKKDLEDHVKLPHKINCSKCCRIFVDFAQLERHIKYDHLENLKKFQCTKCTKKFMTEYYLNSHNQRVHDKKMTICPICSNEMGIYKLPTHLENHKKNERGVKSFCTTCQVYLANKADLEKHKRTEIHLKKFSDKEEEFILPHDLNTVDSLLLIDKRLEEGIFDPNKDKKLPKRQMANCHECGLKFRNYYYRDAHRVKVHGYTKPQFHCTICDINFCRQGVLNTHIKKSTGHKMKEKFFRKN